MTKNPLIPTAVVDKNGRQTTVHKKVESSGSGRSLGIPKVAAPISVEDNCKLIVEAGFRSEIGFIKMSPNVREKMMKTLHKDTLPVMAEILREHEDGVYTFRKAARYSAQGRNFAIANGFVALLNESKKKDRDAQLDILNSLVGVEYCCPGNKLIDITNDEDPYAEGARALIAILIKHRESGLVRLRHSSKGISSYVFSDSEVGRLIVEHPDRAEDIVDLYRKYGTFDKGLFEEALATDARALSDGVL